MPAHVSGYSDKIPSPLLSLSRTPSATPSQQTTRILLAEDNAVNAMIATRYLRNLGYTDVTAVADGQAAVAAVSGGDVHLVLMDCQMPVLDGYEACRRIRALPDPAKRTVPILALTASALQADVDRCMAAGMDDHLAKPYQTRDLALKLNALLPPDSRCCLPAGGLIRSRSSSSNSSSSAVAGGVAATPRSTDMSGNAFTPR
jgi:CheY-like chemotaxis protein